MGLCKRPWAEPWGPMKKLDVDNPILSNICMNAFRQIKHVNVDSV